MREKKREQPVGSVSSPPPLWPVAASQSSYVGRRRLMHAWNRLRVKQKPPLATAQGKVQWVTRVTELLFFYYWSRNLFVCKTGLHELKKKKLLTSFVKRRIRSKSRMTFCEGLARKRVSKLEGKLKFWFPKKRLPLVEKKPSWPLVEQSSISSVFGKRSLSPLEKKIDFF